MNSEHFEVIKTIKTDWVYFGDINKIKIPEGCTHVFVDVGHIEYGYYEDVNGVEVNLNFGRYRND